MLLEESNSDYKQFHEHWKSLIWRSNCRRQASNSVGYRLKFLTGELRWSGIELPKVETQKIFEIRWKKIIPELIHWLGVIFCNRPSLNGSFSAYRKQTLKQRVVNLYGKTRNIFEQLELCCRRNLSNRCRVWRCYSIDCRTQRWRPHLGLLYGMYLSRAQFLLQHLVFHLRWLGETTCKKKNMN